MDKYHYTLHELHKRHCNFQIVRGKSTGTYRFTRVLLDSLDFQDKLDSTVLTREQVSRSKLEDAFSKRTENIINETANTITVLPETAAKEGRGGIVAERNSHKDIRKWSNGLRLGILLNECEGRII